MRMAIDQTTHTHTHLDRCRPPGGSDFSQFNKLKDPRSSPLSFCSNPSCFASARNKEYATSGDGLTPHVFTLQAAHRASGRLPAATARASASQMDVLECDSHGSFGELVCKLRSSRVRIRKNQDPTVSLWCANSSQPETCKGS